MDSWASVPGSMVSRKSVIRRTFSFQSREEGAAGVVASAAAPRIGAASGQSAAASRITRAGNRAMDRTTRDRPTGALALPIGLRRAGDLLRIKCRLQGGHPFRRADKQILGPFAVARH